MKYMLLIYDNAHTRATFLGAEGEALADPSNTRTIRVVDGAPAITDGPFAEAKEHLGGYLIVDCETPERAAEIALRWPSARFSPLEVRPLMDTAGAEM